MGAPVLSNGQGDCIGKVKLTLLGRDQWPALLQSPIAAQESKLQCTAQTAVQKVPCGHVCCGKISVASVGCKCLQMEGNPHVRQIPWDDNPGFVLAWEAAQTGYPWIDAIMTQLKQQGWMHHLARHSVACFLTRGDLWCNWEAGRDVFDKYLLDADHYINNGNWQWLSASDFFFQYFRVYSPVTFAKQYDKSGKFVRHFLPVLKGMPEKYIYEPWKAPKEVQQRAKCIIGKDYPKPIVDHATVSQANQAKMKKAYAAHNAASLASSPQKRKRKELITE
jgi:hypothetical protein